MKAPIQRYRIEVFAYVNIMIYFDFTMKMLGCLQKNSRKASTFQGGGCKAEK